MNNSIMIDGVEYVRADLAPAQHRTEDMRYCIVRCHDAGVHAGFVGERNGREVELFETRRLWRWWGKTLSGLATEGTFAPEKCKFSDEIPRIVVLDACEIIPCSAKAMRSIREDVGPWKNE